MILCICKEETEMKKYKLKRWVKYVIAIIITMMIILITLEVLKSGIDKQEQIRTGQINAQRNQGL
jgi:H+/Cl- antiporter ClcA